MRTLYVVWRDPDGKGRWQGPHGKYTDRLRAEIFAGELARKLGGRTKITVENEDRPVLPGRNRGRVVG